MAFTLKKLSELNAVSGNEFEARQYIVSEIKEKCDGVSVDSIGNVIAFKRGISAEKKIMLGANIDEPGFIVSDITDKGYIMFEAVGSIDPRTIIAKRVVIGRNAVKGIIGIKAVHLTTKEEREKAVKLSDMYIDIGAKNRKKSEKKVRKGDYITFDTEFGSMGECVKGKALGRFGSACLMEAMEQTPAYDTYFVFSAQREIPSKIKGRGMRVAAFGIKPDYALIVDTVDTADGYKSKTPNAVLGGGAVIEYMDKTSMADARLTAAVAKLAAKNGIKTQNKTSSALASIAGAAAQASTGTVIACIGIPCRYSDTPVGFMNKNDINAVTALCSAVVKESDVIINEAS